MESFCIIWGGAVFLCEKSADELSLAISKAFARVLYLVWIRVQLNYTKRPPTSLMFVS
jgi:hypothetical protein